MRSYSLGHCSSIAKGLLLALLLAGAGCGKSGIAQALASFKESGHAVGEFVDTDASAFSAKKCQTGTIDRLTVLLCEHESSESAAMGKSAAETWGANTGTVVVLHRKSMLFAVSDSGHADPDGKSIAALSKTFRRAR